MRQTFNFKPTKSFQHGIFGIGIEVYFLLLVLAIPFYFLYRRIFRKDKTRRTVWAIVVTALAAPIFYVLFVIALIINYEDYPNKNFNKKAWSFDKETRYEYSKDIINSKLLIGKTKKQVKAILGDEGNKETDDTWHYVLGYKPELGNIDPDVLMIEFKNGVVVKVSQHNT